MTIEKMQYYITIVENENISVAAKKLNISQPALSRVLSTIENELQMKLLVRTSTGIKPTINGLEVYLDFKDILKAYYDMREQWNSDSSFTDQVHMRHVTILSIPAMNNILNQISLEMSSKEPEIALNIVNSSVTDLLPQMSANKISIAVGCWRNSEEEELIYTYALKNRLSISLLISYPVCLVVNKQSPLSKKSYVTTDDVVDHTFAYTSAPHELTFYQEYLKKFFPHNPVLRISTTLAAIQLISENPKVVMIGSEISIKTSFDFLNKKICLVPIKDSPFSFHHFMIHTHEKTLSVYEQKAISYIKNYFHSITNN